MIYGHNQQHKPENLISMQSINFFAISSRTHSQQVKAEVIWPTHWQTFSTMRLAAKTNMKQGQAVSIQIWRVTFGRTLVWRSIIDSIQQNLYKPFIPTSESLWANCSMSSSLSILVTSNSQPVYAPRSLQSRSSLHATVAHHTTGYHQSTYHSRKFYSIEIMKLKNSSKSRLRGRKVNASNGIFTRSELPSSKRHNYAPQEWFFIRHAKNDVTS